MSSGAKAMAGVVQQVLPDQQHVVRRPVQPEAFVDIGIGRGADQQGEGIAGRGGAAQQQGGGNEESQHVRISRVGAWMMRREESRRRNRRGGAGPRSVLLARRDGGHSGGPARVLQHRPPSATRGCGRAPVASSPGLVQGFPPRAAMMLDFCVVCAVPLPLSWPGTLQDVNRVLGGLDAARARFPWACPARRPPGDRKIRGMAKDRARPGVELLIGEERIGRTREGMMQQSNRETARLRRALAPAVRQDVPPLRAPRG